MKPTLSEELSYLTAVAKRSPLLEREEELLLARRFRATRDERAADLLMRAHLLMVLQIATKHRRYGLPVSELVAEGNCGLFDALRKFDPDRGLRFRTYAKYWVRAYILAYVVRSWSLVGGAGGLVRSQLFFKLRRERSRMTALLGQGEAADAALATRLCISVKRLRSLLARLDSTAVSLDWPLGFGSSKPLRDTLMADDCPEQCYFTDERDGVVAAAVAAALTALDPRERFIAEHRLMAENGHALSLAQIGRAMGVSRERARQLEVRAKQKMARCQAISGNVELTEWLADTRPALAKAG